MFNQCCAVRVCGGAAIGKDSAVVPVDRSHRTATESDGHASWISVGGFSVGGVSVGFGMSLSKAEEVLRKARARDKQVSRFTSQLTRRAVKGKRVSKMKRAKTQYISMARKYADTIASLSSQLDSFSDALALYTTTTTTATRSASASMPPSFMGGANSANVLSNPSSLIGSPIPGQSEEGQTEERVVLDTYSVMRIQARIRRAIDQATMASSSMASSSHSPSVSRLQTELAAAQEGVRSNLGVLAAQISQAEEEVADAVRKVRKSCAENGVSLWSGERIGEGGGGYVEEVVLPRLERWMRLRWQDGREREREEVERVVAEFAAREEEDVFVRFADVILLGPTGGWEKRDHEMFVKMAREKGEGSEGGGARSGVLDRMRLVLPHIPRQALVLHETFCDRKRHAETIRKRLFGGLVDAVASVFEKSAAEEAEEAARAAAAEEEAAERDAFQALVEEMEGAHAVATRKAAARAAALSAQERKVAAQQEAAEAAEAAKREAERRRIRAELEAYARDKEAASAAAAQASVEAEAARVAAARRARLAGAPRVAYRAAKFRAKVAKEKAERAEKEAEEAARAARLQALADSVAIQAESDPSRLVSATVAAQARSEQIARERVGRKAVSGKLGAALGSVHGYTDDQVFSDSRAKISRALALAGLASSEYGRFVMASARPSQLSRKDTFSTYERSFM